MDRYQDIYIYIYIQSIEYTLCTIYVLLFSQNATHTGTQHIYIYVLIHNIFIIIGHIYLIIFTVLKNLENPNPPYYSHAINKRANQKDLPIIINNKKKKKHIYILVVVSYFMNRRKEE